MFSIYASTFMTAARMEARAPAIPTPSRKRRSWLPWKWIG